MKIERDERKFDFHGIGLAIKKAREREGMTQEQLGYIVDRDPRTIASIKTKNIDDFPSFLKTKTVLNNLTELTEFILKNGKYGSAFYSDQHRDSLLQRKTVSLNQYFE